MQARVAEGIAAVGVARRVILVRNIECPARRLARQHVPRLLLEAVHRVHVARLVDLGAVELYRHDEADGRWITMADPEGNELCLH